MVKQDQKQLDQWVKNWQRAQIALKTVRTRELLKSNPLKQEALLNEMLTYACQQPRQQESTGLVEQQRIFDSIRKTDTTQCNG